MTQKKMYSGFDCLTVGARLTMKGIGISKEWEGK